MWENSKWFFVKGEPNGINDSGISDFKGTRFNGLAREIIQNSLDAKIKDLNEPVIVEFKKRNLTMDKYPNYNNFIDVIDKCIDFIKDKPNDKGHRFYKNLKDVMNTNVKNNYFTTLEISDYNTVGLDDVNDTTSGTWASLVRISGSNAKESGAGGSFGIGKYAPFVFSSSRIIIYSTKNLQGNIAVQGKSILSGHINKGKRSPNGYFGCIKECSFLEDGDIYIEQDSFPFTNASNFPEDYLRTESGTSLFILDVNFDDNWYKEIINSVIYNFYKTIMEKKLIVRVIDDTKNKIEKIEIRDETLDIILNQTNLLDNDKKDKIIEHLKLINSNEKIVITKKFDLKKVGYDIPGELELQIMCNNDINLKSIFFMRDNGMVIKEPTFQNLLPYVANLSTKNSSMNEFLRECEGPKHDEWNGNNFRETDLERKEAKGILNLINNWVRNSLRESCGKTSSEPLEVFGMEDCLPLEYDGKKEGTKQEQIVFKPIDTPLILSKNKVNQKTKNKYNKYELDDNGTEFFEEDNGYKSGNGSSGKKIHNGSTGISKGTVKGDGEISSKVKVHISNIRAPYIQDEMAYRVTFIPEETIDSCEIQVRRAGTDLLEEVKIKKMYLMEEGIPYECKTLNLEKNKKIVLKIELEKNIRGALEVNCHVKK